METFVGGLALAAISGVTFVAYRHPSAYPLLRNILLMVLGVAFFSILGSTIEYTARGMDSLETLLQKQPDIKAADVLPWIRQMNVAMSHFLWTAGICVPSAVYLIFLSALPALIKTDKETR